MKDLISVIIPTYNGEKYIHDCIQSIANQTANHEIIIVDDMSTDKTVEIANEMGVRVIQNTVHRGQVAGKNIGIQNMNGDYFLTIDQDDLLKPNALTELLYELKSLNAQIIMSKLVDFAEKEEDAGFCHKVPFRGILTGAALFKKDVFDIIGLFDESVITGEVIDLMSRCQKNNIEIFKSDNITCERRIHNSNFGRTNQKSEYKDYAKMLRKQFLERINNKND